MRAGSTSGSAGALTRTSCRRFFRVRRCQTEAVLNPLTKNDERAVTAQLGRPPRDAAGVACRCPCGLPAVLATRPRLSDGTPFPTTYYLTCPNADPARIYYAMQGVAAFCYALCFTVSVIYMATVVGLSPVQLVLVGTAGDQLFRL